MGSPEVLECLSIGISPRCNGWRGIQRLPIPRLFCYRIDIPVLGLRKQDPERMYLYILAAVYFNCKLTVVKRGDTFGQ